MNKELKELSKRKKNNYILQKCGNAIGLNIKNIDFEKFGELLSFRNK